MSLLSKTSCVQRVLDLDLDFFLDGVEHWLSPGLGRLDNDDFAPWPLDDALSFLRDRCGLTRPLPGFAVERHGELFRSWQGAIATGRLEVPFSVTHVDAHADLGLGDAGYVRLLTDLVWREPPAAREPGDALGDGNYLAFAVGRRWLADLTYVHNDAGGGDVMWCVMEGFDADAAHIQLAALTKQQIDLLTWPETRPGVQPHHLEPRVPFSTLRWDQFQAHDPFDFVCLARSPEYALFDKIRKQFIDEAAI